MSNYLDDKIKFLSPDKDLLSVDLTNITQNTRFNDLLFFRVRGSVRLVSENVILPFQVEEERKKVIQKNFT